MKRNIVVMYMVNPQDDESWPKPEPYYPTPQPQLVPSVNDFALVLAKLDLILAALEKLTQRRRRKP